jgi:predicted 3-demethylubiquinone-9 3-methyltransferase (glyoxalase superfamily)
MPIERHKITPCLWFDRQAEEAARFYVSIFKNSKIESISRYSKAGQEIHGGTPGSVMTVAFELDGQTFVALNGGPLFKFTEAVSFQVHCANQADIDYYWSKLTEGGQEGPCGWLKDKFGLSWQVVPQMLGELMHKGKPEQNNRVMTALLKMKKLDIATLEKAHAGK